MAVALLTLVMFGVVLIKVQCMPTDTCVARLQFCSKEVQQKWFKRHFELAAACQLPMFLHLRAAASDFLAILEQHRLVKPSTAQHGDMHCNFLLAEHCQNCDKLGLLLSCTNKPWLLGCMPIAEHGSY